MNKAELIQLIRDNLKLLNECSSLEEAKTFINANSSNEGYIIIVNPNTKIY